MKNRGSYSIEGAFTIVIFTACMMALLSLFTIVKLEGEVQDSLNETARTLSASSYAMGKESNGLSGTLLGNFLDPNGVKEGTVASDLLVRSLVLKNFHREDTSSWLKEQGVRGGSGGIRFQETSLFSDGRTIEVCAVYTVKVNTYGLFRKELTIRQTAVTDALLPEDYRSLWDSGRSGAGAESIWKKPAFTRGRYFIGNLRSTAGGSAVKSGQGIDLFDPGTGELTEQYTMNLFSPYYSSQAGAWNDPGSYTPRYESVERELINYGRDFTKDVRGLNGSVRTEDGKNYPVSGGTKKMILVVPVEAQQNTAMQSMLDRMKVLLQKTYGIEVEVRYLEEALV